MPDYLMSAGVVAVRYHQLNICLTRWFSPLLIYVVKLDGRLDWHKSAIHEVKQCPLR